MEAIFLKLFANITLVSFFEVNQGKKNFICQHAVRIAVSKSLQEIM
jgi:hypothetical protein